MSRLVSDFRLYLIDKIDGISLDNSRTDTRDPDISGLQIVINEIGAGSTPYVGHTLRKIITVSVYGSDGAAYEIADAVLNKMMAVPAFPLRSFMVMHAHTPGDVARIGGIKANMIQYDVTSTISYYEVE